MYFVYVFWYLGSRLPCLVFTHYYNLKSPLGYILHVLQEVAPFCRLDQLVEHPTDSLQEMSSINFHTTWNTQSRLHRAESSCSQTDSAESAYLEALYLPESILVSVSESLLWTVLSLRGLLGNAATLVPIYILDRLKATLSVCLTHTTSIPLSLILLCLLCAACVRLLSHTSLDNATPQTVPLRLSQFWPYTWTDTHIQKLIDSSCLSNFTHRYWRPRGCLLARFSNWIVWSWMGSV